MPTPPKLAYNTASVLRKPSTERRFLGILLANQRPEVLMSLLAIRLLGSFQAVYNVQSITALQQPRLQTLLAYLLLQRHAPQARRQLAFLFWPDSSEAQARANLRHLLHDLHLALPHAEHFLLSDNKTVQWNPAAPYTLDVADFAGLLDQAAYAEQQGDWAVVCAKLVAAVDLYQGDLLPDCYADWLLAAREQWQQRYSAALTTLVCGFEAQQNFALAISYAQRLLRHDPLHEATYRHLMRLYARNGESARAIQTYLTCVNLLQRELGVEPEAATQAEVEREILRTDPKPRRFGIACLNYPHNCPANQPQKDRFGIAACDMLGVAVAVFRPFPSIP